MEKDALQKILEDDDLGLLNIKPKHASITVDERLLASFQQINDFYLQNGKEPTSNPSDILEFQLYNRLKGLRASKKNAKRCTKQMNTDCLPTSSQPNLLPLWLTFSRMTRLVY